MEHILYNQVAELQGDLDRTLDLCLPMRTPKPSCLEVQQEDGC